MIRKRKTNWMLQKYQSFVSNHMPAHFVVVWWCINCHCIVARWRLLTAHHSLSDGHVFGHVSSFDYPCALTANYHGMLELAGNVFGSYQPKLLVAIDREPPSCASGQELPDEQRTGFGARKATNPRLLAAMIKNGICNGAARRPDLSLKSVSELNGRPRCVLPSRPSDRHCSCHVSVTNREAYTCLVASSQLHIVWKWLLS